MKVVDLHPEELLDKDARGELTASERERLDVHLARCATCRFERALRADFGGELGDAPQELAPAEIVEIALGHASRAPNAANEDRAPITPRPTARRRFRIPLLVAAAVLVGGAAGAGAAIPTWRHLVTRGEESEVTAHTHEEAPPPAKAAPTHAAPAPTVTEEPEPVASEAVPEPPAPTPVIIPARTLIAPMPFAEPVETSATLFEAAADARRRGDHARALELHRQLLAKFPASREARVSHATIGQLLLDRGDASGALASFDAYRAGGHGPLDEPVMVGRATALDRLGRTDEARAAWNGLLEAFPRTPYAAHARARIDAP
jgi:TolA-binding protein